LYEVWLMSKSKSFGPGLTSWVKGTGIQSTSSGSNPSSPAIA